MTDFPKFVDDQHVFCFNCKTRVTGPFQASGFPEGRGGVRGQCTGKDGCGFITYFDWNREFGEQVRDVLQEWARLPKGGGEP